MKSSSIIAIGGGIAAAIIIGIALTMSGVSDSQDLSENYMGETIDSSESLQENKIHVLASFYPYYEFTRNVAGDSATVLQYMPSGIEAHDWEPRPQEIQSLKDADVFVYNGLGMEPYVENMIDSGEFDNVMFVKVSEGVELIKPDQGHDAHEEDFAKEIEHVIEEFEE
ncbi:MAG: zinc ABC transporter substrate-binding protein, partial [Nitrosopumilus sp.]|nr:zinc ABC transporter substrate-binding protein [Nitrosopumilus sp.]